MVINRVKSVRLNRLRGGSGFIRGAFGRMAAVRMNNRCTGPAGNQRPGFIPGQINGKVRRNTPVLGFIRALDIEALRQIPISSGELYAHPASGNAAQRQGTLHEPLSEGTLTNNKSPIVILQGPGDDFRGGGGFVRGQSELGQLAGADHSAGRQRRSAAAMRAA